MPEWVFEIIIANRIVCNWIEFLQIMYTCRVISICLSFMVEEYSFILWNWLNIWGMVSNYDSLPSTANKHRIDRLCTELSMDNEKLNSFHYLKLIDPAFFSSFHQDSLQQSSLSLLYAHFSPFSRPLFWKKLSQLCCLKSILIVELKNLASWMDLVSNKNDFNS